MMRRTLVAAALVAAGVAIGWMAGGGAARAATDFDGVVPLYAGGDIAFFDAANGDLWVHVPQSTGRRNVEHFRVTKRGATLTSVALEQQPK